MLILCRRCKREFDPEKEMAYCSPWYGHAPVKPSGQKLSSEALQVREESNVKRRQFQSDFRMIWEE